MVEQTEHISLIKPIEKHLRLELWVGDAFLYRKKREADGQIKVYILSEKKVLKRYFASRIRTKLRNFLYANGCQRIDKRYSTYLIPNLQIARELKIHIDLMKETLETKEQEELKQAEKQGDDLKIKEIQKRINYLNRNWPRNKPVFNLMESIPLVV